MINNQAGFTTLPGEGRSSWHASDMAKAVHAPIWHVNAGMSLTQLQLYLCICLKKHCICPIKLKAVSAQRQSTALGMVIDMAAAYSHRRICGICAWRLHAHGHGIIRLSQACQLMAATVSHACQPQQQVREPVQDNVLVCLQTIQRQW